MITQLLWEETIFFFDVDDTLIDTASNSIKGSIAIFDFISKYLNKEDALLVQQRFNRIFLTLMQGHTTRSDKDWYKIKGGKEYYLSIIKRIELLQQPIVKQYGAIKKWSREVILKMASDDCGIDLSTEVLYRAIDEYWNNVSDHSNPMNGVLELFKEIKTHGRPIYLITSSDARLKLNNEGLFIYDPLYSESFKRKRMESLKRKGLDFNAVSIGDPEDKPNLDFFEKGIKIAERDLNKNINTKNSIMFGDSYASDLQTPREMLNFGLVVLYNKNQDQMIVETDRYISTNNIYLATKYLH